jgi:putative oxidoreductase
MQALVADARTRFLSLAGSLPWLAPTAARLTLGFVFVATGWGKLHSLDQVTAFFTTLGIPAPGFHAHLVAGTELVCGGLIIVGLFARLASIPLVITMVVAIATAKMGDVHGLSDFFGLQEFDYIALALVILVLGAGHGARLASARPAACRAPGRSSSSATGRRGSGGTCPGGGES